MTCRQLSSLRTRSRRCRRVPSPRTSASCFPQNPRCGIQYAVDEPSTNHLSPTRRTLEVCACLPPGFAINGLMIIGGWCAPKHTSICWTNPISVRFRQIIAVKRFSCPMSHRHMRLSRSPIQHCNLTGSALEFGVSRLSNFHGCHRASPPPRPSTIPHPQSFLPRMGF